MQGISLVCRQVVLGLAIGASSSIAVADAEVDQLMHAMDDLYQGQSSISTMTMLIETEHFSRSLTIQSWSKGTDHALMKILAPIKEKGTTTLKAGNEIWNYLPKINRVIKVPSSMMGAGWMGSHFTNDDLLKENRYSDDYDCHVSERLASNTVVACTPHEEAALVWGRVDIIFATDTLLPQGIVYYDEDMQATRNITFSQVATMGGRTLPTQMEVTVAEKPGERTLITYDSIEFDVDIDDSMFTIMALKRESRK